MKYVIDSCTAFKWFVPEADTDKALQLRDDFHRSLIELLAPDVFPVEICHAITRVETGENHPGSRIGIRQRPAAQPASVPFLDFLAATGE
jgi:hypothetical protein